MTTHAVYVGGGPERQVGQVYAEMTLSNDRDRILAEEGLRDRANTRQLTLNRVLVDTGATTLCLPADMIATLGLRMSAEVAVDTAAGGRTARLFESVRIRIEDREAQFDCIELPGGGVPLLGVIPLERLGFEPDLQAQRLRKLPMGPDGSYLTIY